MNDLGVEAQRLYGPLLARVMQRGRDVEHRLEAALEPQRLSLTKLLLLHQLVQAEHPIPLGELSDLLGCARSNITQLIDRLESDGLVERQDDPTDRRSRLAAITPAGRARYAAGREAVAAAEGDMLAVIGAADRGHLARLLDRFPGEAPS